MSGDIGSGATAACIRLAEKVLDTRGEGSGKAARARGKGPGFAPLLPLN